MFLEENALRVSIWYTGQPSSHSAEEQRPPFPASSEPSAAGEVPPHGNSMQLVWKLTLPAAAATCLLNPAGMFSLAPWQVVVMNTQESSGLDKALETSRSAANLLTSVPPLPLAHRPILAFSAFFLHLCVLHCYWNQMILSPVACLNSNALNVCLLPSAGCHWPLIARFVRT